MKFLRRIHDRYSRLGKRRKKKQIWRKPTGRDNKMREMRRGQPAVVKIGYKKGSDKKMIMVNNLNDLKNVKNNEIAVVGNIGKKKKMEIAKKAEEMKINLHNLNPKSFLKKTEKKKMPAGGIKK